MSGPELTQAQKDYQLARPDETSTGGLVTYTAIGLVIVEIAVGLRMWGRYLQKIKLRADDYTLLVAAVLVIGYAIGGILNIKWGAGHHTLTDPKAYKVPRAKANYANNVIYTVAFPIARISLVLLYMRVFIKQWFKYVCWFMIFSFASYAFSTAIIDLFGQMPINANWNSNVELTRKIDFNKLVKANCYFNIVSDFIILVLPLAIIWSLQMRKLTKLGLSLIFCLGGLTLIASIMRFYYIETLDKIDPNFDFANGAYWTITEMYLGLLCPCLVTFQPILILVYRVFLKTLTPHNRGRVSRFTGVSENISYAATKRDKDGRILQSDEDVRITTKEVGPSLSSKPSDLEAQQKNGGAFNHEEMPYHPQHPAANPPRRPSASEKTAVAANEPKKSSRDEDGMALDQDAAVARLDPRMRAGNGKGTMGSSASAGVEEKSMGQAPDHPGIGVKKEWDLESHNE